MGQYLHWYSYHHKGVKYIVINTLNDMTQAVSAITQHHRTEIEHTREVITRDRHPAWAIGNRIDITQEFSTRQAK